MNDSCLICQKHLNKIAGPPGGYLYEDDFWKVCHAPSNIAKSGTLIIESRRHFLDFTEMKSMEAKSYGQLVQKMCVALKAETGAERIYNVVLLEGIPHFHAWLIPRLATDEVRGSALLNSQVSCDEEEAVNLVARMRANL